MASQETVQMRDKHRDTWVSYYLTLYKKQLFYALTLGVVTLAFSVLLMFVAGWLIAATSTLPDGGIFAVYLPIIFVQIFGIGKPVLRYLERIVSHDWVFRMTSHMRLRLFNIVTALTRRFDKKLTTGDVLGYISEDIGHIQNLYLRTIFPTTIAWVFYTILVVALGFIDIKYALVMLVLFVVCAIIAPRVFAYLTKKDTIFKKSKTNALYANLTDNVIGATDWVFSNRGNDYMLHYKNNYEDVSIAKNNITNQTRRARLILSVVFALAAVVTLVWTGLAFGESGAGDARNWIAAFMLGFFPLFDVFSPLVPAHIQSNTYNDSITRLNELPEDTTTIIINEAPQTHMNTTEANIDIKKVSFTYPNEANPVLKDITLKIPAGQKVAILGASGSGKSTLLHLLRGKITPTVGNIIINSVPIQNISETISSFISVVPQQIYIFNRTLRENINLAHIETSDEKILDVLHNVGLDNLVERLEKGLDTIVDEAGTRFSGGERQRIGLARVLLAQTPIVLLDEPCNSLDAHTEQEVLNTLFKTTGNKTLLMVTHHLQGIEMFDRVIFIEDGHIVADGTPQQLAHSNKRYQKLLAFDRGL